MSLLWDACVTCLPSFWRSGAPVHTAGLGTVVRTFHSAPRPPGASMVVGSGRFRRRVGFGWLCRRRRL